MNSVNSKHVPKSLALTDGGAHRPREPCPLQDEIPDPRPTEGSSETVAVSGGTREIFIFTPTWVNGVRNSNGREAEAGGAAEAERFVAWSQDRFWVRAG